MLEALYKAAWIAAFAFVVAFWLAMALKSSQQPIPNEHEQPAKTESRGNPQKIVAVQQNKDQADKKRNNESHWYDRLTDWLLVTFSGLLVLATIALFISAEKAADAAKDSADIARETLVSTNRAWVAIPFANLGRPLEGGPPLLVQFRIENTGKEPALGFKWLLKPILIPYLPDGSREKDYSEPNKAVGEVHSEAQSGGVLWSGSETKFWIPWRADDTPENRAMLEAVLSRKNSLIVDIAIAYVTVGEEHKSWARYFLRDVPGTSDNWKFNLLPTGNGAN